MNRLICLILLLAFNSVHARTWTDNQGRTMEAEAVSMSPDGMVTFRKSGGMVYQVPLDKLSEADQTYLQEQVSSGKLEQTKREPTSFTGWLEVNLVSVQNGKMKRLRDSDVSQVDYIAVYQSAHWCGPCLKFTPKLVNWYNVQKPKHPNFEVVFVSSDHSEEDMEYYMAGMKMPWPALEYDRRDDSRVDKSSGNGIPCLMIFDREGNLIMDSYEDGKYIGPTRVMNHLETLISE